MSWNGLKMAGKVASSGRFPKERVSVDDTFRCRKCRVYLFSGRNIGPFHEKTKPVDQCSSWYLDIDEDVGDLFWVRDPIDQAQWTEGKIYCPKCKSRLGAFDFLHGVKCSCFNFVIPAVWIQKCKVDQIINGDASKINIRNATSGLNYNNNASHGPSTSSNPNSHVVEAQSSSVSQFSPGNVSASQLVKEACQTLLTTNQPGHTRSQGCIGQYYGYVVSTTYTSTPTGTLYTNCVKTTTQFTGILDDESAAFGHYEPLEELNLNRECRHEIPIPNSASIFTSTSGPCHSRPISTVTSNKHSSKSTALCEQERRVRKRKRRNELTDDQLILICKNQEGVQSSNMFDDLDVVEGARFDDSQECSTKEIVSNTKVEEDVEELPDHLTCPVCLDLLFEPFSCGCGHIFCDPCLRLLNRKSCKAVLRCPLCRKPVEYVYAAEVLRAKIRNKLPLLYRRRCKMESRSAHRRLPLPDGKPKSRKKKSPRYTDLKLPYFILGFLVCVFVVSVIGVVVIICACPPGSRGCTRGELD